MNTSKNEFLSALLDDEAGEFERRRLLDELSRDDAAGQALGQTLNRYALVGEAMRARQNVAISDSTSFLAGIHAGLEDEPKYNETVVQFADVPAAANDSFWRSNALRAGMAASVAVAAIASVLLFQSGNQSASSESMAANNNASGTMQTVVLTDGAVNTTTETGSVRTMNLADSSRIRQSNQYMDHETRGALKQYVTLHMQHRANNSIITSIQASNYSQ